MFADMVNDFDKSVAFLQAIGIEVQYKKIAETCFLPGLSIENGAILIDKDALKYPGDLLHEAGHIAVVPAAERSTLNAASIAQRKDRVAEELMAIAWSYAACKHLDINPSFVFHEEGYAGGGSYIEENFNEKRYFGLPMLQWIGLTADEKNAVALNVLPYPNMIRWMRD